MAGTKDKADKAVATPVPVVEVSHEEKFVAWIRANQKPLGIGLGAVVVLFRTVGIGLLNRAISSH